MSGAPGTIPSQMVINSEILHPLTREGINCILFWPGVVALVVDDEEVAYVEAMNLKETVRRILAGEVGPSGATHFRVYTSTTPLARKEELLALFQIRYGRLPRLQAGS